MSHKVAVEGRPDHYKRKLAKQLVRRGMAEGHYDERGTLVSIRLLESAPLPTEPAEIRPRVSRAAECWIGVPTPRLELKGLKFVSPNGQVFA